MNQCVFRIKIVVDAFILVNMNVGIEMKILKALKHFSILLEGKEEKILFKITKDDSFTTIQMRKDL